MINPTGKKLQKIISKMIDDDVEGVDKYTLNGSTWLIFTDQKRWVIEYTSDNILWYNYSFFTEIFDLLSMKATDNQNLIQEWFESKFLRPEVKHTFLLKTDKERGVEHTIQNGVKDTIFVSQQQLNYVEHTIQNGVKDTHDLRNSVTRKGVYQGRKKIEHTIQNGVKHIERGGAFKCLEGEGTIQNGVKDTHKRLQQFPDNALEAIQNGVKHTKLRGFIDDTPVEYTIQNGVKHTFTLENRGLTQIEDTIQNGVKDTIGWDENQSEEVEETIQNGVKETKGDRLIRTLRVIKTIQNGVKQTNPMDEWVNSHNIISDVMDYGNVEMVGTGHATDNEMNDVIENGVKEIRTDDGYVNHFRQNYKFNNVFEDIVKEVQSDCSNNTERVNGVIRIGEKLN